MLPLFLTLLSTPAVAPALPTTLPPSYHDSFARTRAHIPNNPVLSLSVADNGTTRILTGTALFSSSRMPLLGIDSRATAALSPSGSHVALVTLSKKVGLLNTTTQQWTVCETAHDSRPTMLTFAANGTRVVASWPVFVAVWDLQGKLIRGVKDDRGWTAMPAATVTAEGHQLVLGSRAVLLNQGNFTVGSSLRVMNLKDGSPVWDYQRGTLPHTAIASSNNGRWIATAGASLREPAVLDILDARSGAPKTQTVLPSRGVSHVAFSPDSRTVVVQVDQHQILLIEVATGMVRGTFSGHRGEADPALAKDIGGFGSDWVTDFTPPTASWVAGPTFSPSGRFLATTVPEGSVYVWDLFALPVKRKANPTREECDQAWETMGEDDAVAAYAAIQLLANHPTVSLPVIQARAREGASLSAARVAVLMEDLDSPQFTVREAAQAELMKHADEVAPAVRLSLAQSPSPEVIKRATAILQAGVKAERLRIQATRVVEATQRMGTPAAKATLAQWATGTAGATLAGEAR